MLHYFIKRKRQSSSQGNHHIQRSRKLRCLDAMYRHLGYISVVSEFLLAPTALLTQVPKMGTESLDASRVFHNRQAPIGP